jgi:hypothetical protein
VYYHRHILSVKLGRWLSSKDVVHHLDGNRENNHPSNLVLTTKNGHNKFHITLKPHPCKQCGKPTIKKVYCCAFCHHQGSRKFNVTKKELQRLLWKIPTSAISKMFGVSDKAIEKRSKLLGLEKPPRGYWMKKGRNVKA